MGLRSNFILLNDETDLIAALFMVEAASDILDYETFFTLHYFCKRKGFIWAAVSHDGTIEPEDYGIFSPVFSNYVSLDALSYNGQLTSDNRWKESKILGPNTQHVFKNFRRK